MPDLTERQLAVIRYIGDGNSRHSAGANDIGFHLVRSKLISFKRHGSKKRGNAIFPATSILRSLERRKLVTSFPSDHTQWAIRLYCLTGEGRKLMEGLR